jgi:hypothetical protein
MLIQCTKKLLGQLNIKPASSIEEEPLFSWHANLITLNRRKTVVLVNDKNRYVIVLYGLKARDFKKLDEHILNVTRETFSEECIKSDVIEQFIKHSGNIVYAGTKNRTSVARMNKSCEAVQYFQDLLDDDSIYQSSLGTRASRFFVGNGKNDYIKPNEELYKDLKALYREPIFSCKAAVVKITLDLENHNVWRRIVVPIDMTFKKFHNVIQRAFNWKDYHLYEFYIYENEVSDNNYSKLEYINHPAHNRKNFKPIVNLVCSDDAFEYPNEIEMKLENGIKLSEYIPKYKNIKYNYDFGDDWQHYIEVEKTIDDYDKNYPACIEGEGNTPPEDVGGEPGYDEFLKIIADKNNPEYENMFEWGKSQGYREFDIDTVNREIKYI